MRRIILIHDGDCAGCTELAREMREHDSLASLEHDTAQNWPGAAPALIVVEGDREVERFTGWRMRWKLGRMLGVRRFSGAPRLLELESRARDRRRGSGPSRRSMLLGAVAGTAAVTIGGVASGAQASPRGGVPAGRALSSAESANLRAVFAPYAEAHGAVSEAKLMGTGTGQYYQLTHGKDSMSFILARNKRVGITLTAEAHRPAARITKIGTDDFITLSAQNDRVVVVPGRADASRVQGSDDPSGAPQKGPNAAWRACMMNCLRGISWWCQSICLGAPLSPPCLACAGQEAVRCADECSIYW